MIIGNLLDYLDWRGDIPFSVDPFNEVDNLVLATLAYTEFDGIVPGAGEGTSISVQDANALFWKQHTHEEVGKATTFYKDSPLLLEKMAASVRYRDLKLLNHVNRIDTDRDEQMSAITFLPGNGITYVAYKGTDDTLVGWKEDFNFSYTEGTDGQKDAARYLSETQKGMRGEIFVGGHSKGGNFAIYASAFCDEEVQARIQKVYSNDGPGFSEGFIEKPEIGKIKDRIVKYTPEFSTVGALLYDSVEPRVVRSSQTGMMQHDAFSWQILRNQFVFVEGTSRGSVIFDQTMREWISGESPENRKLFIDSLFGLFDATGVTTLSEVNANKLQVAVGMMKALQQMPTESREAFSKISQNLGKSLQQTVRAGISDEFGKFNEKLLEGLNSFSLTKSGEDSKKSKKKESKKDE